jgi:hypothetical protein
VRRGYWCIFVLGWLICACNQNQVEYSLDLILPSPATPGEMVTAFGQFPANLSVTLGDDVIAPIAIGGGFQFTVPAKVIANTYVLEVKGGPKPLAGIVQVLPKIQQVSFTGQELTIAGLGWPLQNLTGVKISVNGTDVPPNIKDGKLVTSIPLADIYGTISIRVDVNGQLSDVYNLVRAAEKRCTRPVSMLTKAGWLERLTGTKPGQKLFTVAPLSLSFSARV